MHLPQTSARLALWFVLAGLAIGWVLFLLAALSDVLVVAGLPAEELWDPGTAVPVRPSTYLTLVAIAVFTAGGLLGRGCAARVQVRSGVLLPQSVLRLSTTITVIGIGLAAWTAVSVFFTHFLSDSSVRSPLERALAAYLPIALYTGIVVVAILIGFIFTARPLSNPGRDAPTGREEQKVATADVSGAETHQRSLAWAYSAPILAIAAALIFGLIIYDITQTALEAWIWVVVQALIAAGIIAGTLFAVRAASPPQRGRAGFGSAVSGARLLAHVLSIVFTVVVTGMSLGYGVSAINALQLQPSLSLSAYTGDVTGTSPADLTVSADGSGLQKGTDAILFLEPGHTPIASAPVERDGSFWVEETLDDAATAGLTPGDYRLTATAMTTEGTERTVDFTLTIAPDSTVVLPDEPYASNSDEVSRVSAPSIGWLIGDLLPSAIMLLLVLVTLRQTLLIRSRVPVDGA